MNTLAILAVMFGASVQSGQATQQAATIRHIAVTGDDHDLGVEITATQPVTPLTQTVTDPDRLIVDLPQARPAAGLQKIPINRGKLKGVRVGLLSANPPVTRVVLDLTAATEYRASTLANKIVVRLSNESESRPAPTAPTTDPQPDARAAESTPAVATTSALPSGSSPLRWIMPILVMTAVMAMLVIAVFCHLQNRHGHRGL